MPTIPHPNEVSKFIRGTVALAFHNLDNVSPNPPVPHPVTSTQAQPDSLMADAPIKAEASPSKGHPQRRSRPKDHKPKYRPEDRAKNRTETMEGYVRRDLFGARNMPLEGQPAVERYMVPEEASTDEALHTGEAHPRPATTVPPSLPGPFALSASHERAGPEDSTDCSEIEDCLAFAYSDPSAPTVSPGQLGPKQIAESRRVQCPCYPYHLRRSKKTQGGFSSSSFSSRSQPSLPSRPIDLTRLNDSRREISAAGT